MGSASSSTQEASESFPIAMCDKNYVFDRQLKIIPKGWDSPGDPNELSHGPPATFPSIKTFANLAKVAYFKHGEDGKIISAPKYEVQLEEFTFLAAAKNRDRLNGYFGVAYVDRKMKQVILSHRGTVLSTIGALFTDLNGIVRKNFVPQVSSAITFAHKVVHYAAKQGFDVFFTGHSLGGWLAQITTFSTMYLTLDEVTGHFCGKESPHTDVQMPFTVAFDSPGAYEFLFSLKKALFPRQVESTQEISVEALPIEVFLFHPNPVNWINHQIGRVFILDVEKVGVDTGRYFGRGTHGIEPVLKLLDEFGEDDAVRWRVIDFRKGKKDFTFNSRDVRERTVPCDKTSVPLYFFSREERNFLEGAKRDFPPEGQFEGVNFFDEETANSLLKLTSENSLWKLTGGEESVVTAGGLDRREFIPRVRHTVRCRRQRGTLWWNPRKSQLPPNYIERRKCPTAKLTEFTALPDFYQNEENDIKLFSASENLEEAKTLVLFVDPPGMGKSSAMTRLEMQLRSKVSSSPRVVVRLNLNQVQHTLKSQGSNTKAPDEPYNSACFIQKFVENIPVPLLQKTFPWKRLPLYVLLDGLDEVCPEYEQIMTRILQGLLSDITLRLFSVHKVILTTRPHLQTLIEKKFHVEANSLLPLLSKEQVEFLQREVESSSEAEESLKTLPHTARSLMENPLMLSLFAQILKSHGTKGVVNLLDLYSQFVTAKHELHVVEKEEAGPAKMTTRQRVQSMLDDNLKFYFACAVEELISMSASYLTEASLEQPSGRKLKELMSYGLLVSNEKGGCRFKHRSFAEFFYAQLVTHEAKEYRKLRAVLFGRMYEHNGAQDVGRFVREILFKRQEELSQSPESFPTSYLREEEAASYLGKETLRRLANGWINSLSDKGEGLEHLLWEMKLPHSAVSGLCRSSRFKEVRGELPGAVYNKRALKNFYDGNLFPFLCGRSVLLSLDYSHPDIFHSMKYNTEAIGVFLEWLRRLGNRSWVRAKVFGMKEGVEGGEHPWDGSAESAELILMFAVRSDDIREFLSHEEISAALDSLDSVVKDAWRVEEVEVGRVRWTLEKYVDPQKLKESLLLHLRTVDDFLFSHIPRDKVRSERQESSFEWSWWYAEVFSRKEVRSFVTQEASRVPNIHRIGWRAVKDAWGEEFQFPREQRLNLTRPPHAGKTLLDIKEGDLEFATFFCNEMERGELKLEGDLLEVFKGMIFGDECGWKVLEMLERRLARQRHSETNLNNCSSQETNIVEQLFKSVQGWTTLFDTLQAKLNSCKDPADILKWRRHELNTLWAWLPFVVRYSEETGPIKLIIQRFASIRKYLRHENLPHVFPTETYFGNAARSLLLAHSSEATGSSSLSQLIRSFLHGLERELGSLLKVLLETNEDELRTRINDNSYGTPPTVTHTPLGPVLSSLLNRNKSDESMSTLAVGQTMASPWNAESVAFIFTELIETSACYKLPRALKQFLSSFPPDLIKEALLTKQVYACFKSKRHVVFRKHVFVNTERLCSLRAAIRLYFVAFGEELRWIKSTQAGVNLLTILPVEILSVLEDEEETVDEGFPPLPIEAKLSLVSQIEEKLRKEVKKSVLDCLDFLAQLFSYNTETDWVRLLHALHLIPYENIRPIGCSRASLDHNHNYQNIVESRLLLIRVFLKYLGAKKTRRSADKNSLWDWIRCQERVPRAECLHLAVEVGSLKGVKTFAWPGLLKWKNPCGKTAGEVAVERWGAQHEISRFLEERFQTVRVFHDEQ